jgi:ketosteroid isomerase-like protein
MATANVALVRSICAAWERGDYRSAEWAHPDIEFVLADGPDPGTWTGLEGMAEGWRGRLGPWQGFRQEADEFRELDAQRVLVSFRVSGRGKTSGLNLAQVHPRSLGLFEIRDDKVTRFVAYFDRERALGDLGLAPEAGSSDS